MNTVPWYLAVLILATAQQFTDASLTEEQLAKVVVRVYPGASLSVYVDSNLSNAGSLYECMDKNKSTVIVFAEWGSGFASESVQVLVDAYLKVGLFNVVAIDISGLGPQPLDLDACLNILGVEISVGVNLWIKAGLLPEKLHCVGYSHGYYIGVSLAAKLSVQLHKLIGLDPAGLRLGVSVQLFAAPVNVNFTLCIRTDAGEFGSDQCKCDAVFLPNNGIRVQPGCPLIYGVLSIGDFCSHHRAYKYHAEALTLKSFIGVKCLTSVAFSANLCSQNEKVPMGYDTPHSARGTFYLTTNSVSPYGLKDAGC